jgi:hypothetical protein
MVSFCMLVSSTVIEINILFVQQILDHFVGHSMSTLFLTPWLATSAPICISGLGGGHKSDPFREIHRHGKISCRFSTTPRFSRGGAA